MRKKAIQRKATALLLAAAVAMSGLTGVQLNVETAKAADLVDMSDWEDSILVDFGTGTNISDGVDTDLSATTMFSGAGYTTEQTVVAGYGTYLYESTDVGTMYGKEATEQNFGFDKVMPAGVTSAGGGYFRDWICSPDGEAYNLSVDLKPGQYRVYVYSGNKISGYSNTTKVFFNDMPAVTYEQTSVGGTQWGSRDLSYADTIYTVNVPAQDDGTGKLVMTLSDDIVKNDGVYDSSYTTENTFFINDASTAGSVTYNTNGVDCDGKIATARLNGIEIIPVENPVSATDISAGDIIVEEASSEQIICSTSPEQVTDRFGYVSNDTSIAKVDVRTGLVTGVKAGTTTVSVYTSSGVCEIVNVTVKKVPMLTIDKSSLALNVDGAENSDKGTVTVTFTADTAEAAASALVLPESSEYVTYTKGNVVAGEEDGIYKQDITITAIAAGEYDFVIALTGRSDKTATCTVNITRPVTSVKFVDDNYTDVTSYSVPLDGTLTVKGIALPNNASNTEVTYTVEDVTVASVTKYGGKVTPKKEGTTNVIVTSSADSSITMSVPLKVTAALNSSNGDEDNTGGNGSGSNGSSSGNGTITDTVKLAKASVIVAAGKTACIGFTASKTPVVKSSNSEVTAKVSGNNIAITVSKKATKGSTATITVTAGSKSATIKVTVQNKAKKIKAAKKTVTIKKKGKKAKVAFAVTATNKKKAVADTIKATSANKKVAKVTTTKVSKGKVVLTVKGVKKGKTTITLKIGKKKAKVTVRVKK